MLDNIYMLTSKMQHELSTTSAKRHQYGQKLRVRMKYHKR